MKKKNTITSPRMWSSQRAVRVVCVVGVLIALVIRGALFGHFPNGLNRDEASLGYNAWLIGLTGRDEYQKFFPTTITSFGDEKLPGYVYLLVPFVRVLGLHEWSVRLPSFLAGVVLLITLPQLARRLAYRIGFSERGALWAGVITLGVAIVTPWMTHFSLVAYEAHVATMWWTVGWWWYERLAFRARLHPVNKERSGQFWSGLWISTLLWALSAMTYHTYQIVIPLFVMLLIWLDYRLLWPRVKKASRLAILNSVCFPLFGMLLLLSGGILKANARKGVGTFALRAPDLLQKAFVWRYTVEPSCEICGVIVANRGTELFATLANNWANSTFGTHWITQKNGHGDHNPGGAPNVFVWHLVFTGMSLIWIARHVQQRELTFALLLWFVCTLPAALTTTPGHTVRLVPAMTVMILCIGLGLGGVLMALSRRTIRTAILVCVVSVMGFTYMRYLVQYTMIAPHVAEQKRVFHLLGKAIAQYHTQWPSAQLYAQKPNTSAYIWYVFEQAMLPQEYWQGVERFPVDEENFQYVRRIGNVHFENIEWPDVLKTAETQDVFAFFRPEEVQVEMRTSGRLELIDTIAVGPESTSFGIWKVKKSTQ